MAEPISDLAAGLESGDAGVRAAAAERLARLGPEARGAAVALVRACGDEPAVREWAVAALEELGTPPAGDVGPLAALIENTQADVAYWAATLLGRLGAEAAPAAALLAAALANGRDPSVRQRAAWALGRIGPAARVAAPALQSAAASADPRLAKLAHEALARISGA
jgi:HEAT repeat protein